MKARIISILVTTIAFFRQCISANKLPRDAIQFITVSWYWSNQYPPKGKAIREFKQIFDFEALRQMWGK